MKAQRVIEKIRAIAIVKRVHQKRRQRSSFLLIIRTVIDYGKPRERANVKKGGDGETRKRGGPSPLSRLIGRGDE